MANAFNLTAQINLRGPANIKTVVADIRRQLGTINTDINLKVNPQASRSIDTVRTRLDAMNNALIQARQNTDQLNASLQNLASSLGNIQNISSRTSSAVGKTSSSASSAAKNIKTATTEMEEFGKQSALAVRRFAAFSVVTTGIFSLINAVNNGFKAFVEFDKELIRLQQVTGKGALGLKSLEKEITNLALSLGVSSTSLTTVATTLAQAGLSAEETRIALAALAKTELAPSFDNLVDTTEGAIAAIRQFGLEAGQLESALGSINAVAAAFAVESGDIISAIQRTGGVFAAASKGVSEGTDALNEFISIFTSVRQTTRESAETIATGLRTIFTRIQRAQTIDQLRDFGVELTDLEGKFVGPFEAVRRLSDALSQLDPRDLRFSKIVEELGGFRQIGKVIPLIQQFAVAQTALKVAQKGQSSLVDAQIIAQQSLANQLSKVREQFLALIRDVGQSQTFQSLFKIVTGLTSGLISLAGAFKPILPILAIFGLAKGLKAATQFTTGFVGNLKKGGGAQSVGQNLGDTVTGQNQKTNVEATNQASKIIAENTSAVRTLTDAMNNLRNSANDISNVIVNSTNALANVITNNRGGGSTGLNSGGFVRKFARGGVVPGSGNTDSVAAMLQPGEFVIRKKAVEAIGTGNLHKMNKYATGGPVRASELPSAEIKQRVKNANSKEAKNNPELFRKGYFLTNSDEIVFNKNEYGLKADPNINPLDFETLVAKKINGTKMGGNAPVDIINSDIGNAEVRSRIRTTRDKVLLDKFLRQRIKDNKPLISNNPNQDKDLEFKDSINVVYNTGKLQRDRFKKLSTGGIIQKFVGGGTVEELALAKNLSIEQVLLEQLQALGGGAGIKQIIGSSGGSSLARKALRKDAIESGRYLKEATDFVNQALAAKGTRDAAQDAKTAKLTRVGVAGLLPIGYNKDFEWNLENNNSVYANVRGLSDRYKDAIIEMQMETSTAASRFAENLQYGDIFGGGEPLVFDFDETLVSGSDILGADGKPDIPKYSDEEAVKKALQKGRLTRLGLKLKNLVQANPDFIKNTRILTARPQSTAELLASTLQRLGLPYESSNITGVGQAPGRTGVKKAANLAAVEKLIDDNLENITAVAKAGKKGFLYTEPNPQKALDEIIGQGNIEGAVIEKALALLGANLPPIDQLESNRAVDFPQGLGRAAQFFGIDPNIPTEVKRTLDSSSFEKARAEFARYFTENKFADGGLVQHFAEGSMVRSTKNRRRGAYGKRGFVPLNSREYAAFAENAYSEAGPYGGSDWGQSSGIPMPKVLADYADKIQKYVFETGGAGISLGKKLVKIPDDIDSESLEALKEDLIKRYDGWYSEIEEVMPFGKEILTQTPDALAREARTQAASRAAESNSVYTQAEDAIGIFKQTGQLSLDPTMDTYIRGAFPGYIKQLEQELAGTTDADEKKSILRKLNKAQKAMPDYMALASGAAMPNQGRITGLSETLYSLLDQFGNKSVSVGELDNVVKALGSKLPAKFANGGMARPRYSWAEDKSFYDSENSKRTWYNVFKHSDEKPGSEVVYSGSFDDIFTFLEQKRKEQNTTKKMATGGSVKDTVPALLTPGEFVINKEAAQTIGSSTLNRLNQADRIPGFNKGGLVGAYQYFADGGAVRNPEDAFIEYKARQSNMGERQYRLNLASKVADAQVNMGRDFQGRQEEFRYGLVNDQARLKGIDTSTDVGQNQLEQAITEMANRIQAFDPTMDFDKAREAATQLADGLRNSNVDQLEDVMNKADKLGDIFRELSDEGARAEKAFASVARQENIDVSILKNQVNNREIDRQKFIRSPEGQRFGKLAEIAPDFTQRFAGSKFGGALGAGADFVSGRGGRISKLFAGAGGFTGIGAGVAVATDQARQFLPASLKSNANVAGALGAVGGAGSGAASGALLGTQIAGPVGTLIGGIGGAIIGGIDGWFAGKNQQALSNSLDQITKSSSDLDMAFKKLDQNASKVNFDNAQKAFGKVLSDTDQLNSVAFGERSTVGSMAGSGAIGAAGGAAVGAALGSVVPILGTALGAAAGAAIGGIAGAFADYRSRPTTAERDEALQTRIGMSTQNQQSATRLFETDLSKMSTASIDKTIKDLQNGTTTLSPIAEQYAKSSIAAAGGTEALTQSQIEQIRIRAEESAALDAFSAAMKQAGMTDEKVREMIKKNESEALNKGREISKEQSILAAKSALLARVTRDLAVATEQTLDIYRRAIAGVQRYSQELESFQANALNRSGDLTGKAKAGRVDRTNERILSNISAFSLDEVKQAARQTGGIAGGGAAGSKLERDILAAKVLRDELPKAIKEAGSGGSSADIIGILEKSFANAGVVFSDELKAQIKGGIDEKTIASDQNVGIGDITDPAIIDGLLKGPEEALKFAAELQSKYNDTLETANTLLAEFNELTNEAAEWQRKAASIRYSAEIELARALGNSPTLAQLNKPIDDNIRSITAQNGLIPGGSTDPQAIFNAMQRGRANADMLQERINNTRSQIGLPGANNAALNQSIEDQTRALNKQKAALNDGNRALKELAQDGSKAANALSKIQDRRQQAQAVSDLTRRVLTSDNDELNQLNKGLSAYTKTISGRATSGDMANLDFRRQAFEGLDSISSILPAGVAQKMQARLSRTMLESTAEGRQALDKVITEDGDGGQMTLRDALNNAESGIDPQQQKYIDAYRAATEVQARAAELLAQNALLAAEQLNMDIKELFAGIETKLGQILDRAMGEAGARQAENRPKQGGGAFNVPDDGSKPVQKPRATVPSTSVPPTANNSANFTNTTGSSMVTQPANVPHSGGRPAVKNAQGQWVDPVFGLPVMSPSVQRNTATSTTRPAITNTSMVSPQIQPALSPYQQIMKNRRDAYEQEMERRRNNFSASRGLPTARAPSRNSGPVPANITQPSQPVSTTQTNNNGIQNSNNTQPSIMIDENSRQFMEAFSTTLQSFGSYVDKLAEIKIPEKIEMSGTHIVDVRISGAAAFEGLKKEFNDMVVAEVSKEMNKIWAQSGGKLGKRPQ
jgi:hypothetical protein